MNADAAERHERPTLISGRKVLLFSLVFLVAATFLATWLTLRWVEAGVSDVDPLQWSQRGDWNALRVQWKEIAPPPGPRPPFESKYRSITINSATPEQLAAVATLASIADVADAADLRPLVEQHPEVFYGWYLLGLAHERAGDADAAAQAFERALRLAPAAVVIPIVDEDGNAAADLTLPRVALACGQKIDGELDDSVRLIYPHVTTDARGRVYLPVFDVPCQVTELQGPADRVVVTPWPGWFIFPGQVGMLPAAEVRNR